MTYDSYYDMNRDTAGFSESVSLFPNNGKIFVPFTIGFCAGAVYGFAKYFL